MRLALVEVSWADQPGVEVLPGAGHDNRTRWIAFAILLFPMWALAATHYGYGMVPEEVRRFLGAAVTRFWPGAPPAPPT